MNDAGSKEGSPAVRLGIMIGGGGRTMLNIADCIEAGSLRAEIGLVVASREKIAGVKRARDRGLPVEVVNARRMTKDNDPVMADARINKLFQEAAVDLVCMAGYMRYFRVAPYFQGRVLNIHPALLPAFGGRGMYGLRVHTAVLERGCTVSGCTVHYVDDEYDHGPIIVQRTCPVLAGDTPETLAARVFEQECIAYPEAIEIASMRLW